MTHWHIGCFRPAHLKEPRYEAESICRSWPISYRFTCWLCVERRSDRRLRGDAGRYGLRGRRWWRRQSGRLGSKERSEILLATPQLQLERTAEEGHAHA